MPWSVKRSSDCPDDKPWAVVNDETGASEGCHASEDDAKRQQAALYANTDEGDRTDEQQELVPSGRVEVRSVAFTDIEAAQDGHSFEGYAAVFGAEADLGDFTESINRGAFRKALSSGQNVPMLYNHNPELPWLASLEAGTLELKEDGQGLRVKADIARHFIGSAVIENVRRGEIRGMSFGFVAGPGNSQMTVRRGKPHRTLTGFTQLLDVSPTPDPAYTSTSAEVRSLLQAAQMADQLEEGQEVLTGSYQQLEDAAPPSDVDTDDGSEEARSGGSEEAHSHLLAAKRRLRVMQATIPKEYRQ